MRCYADNGNPQTANHHAWCALARPACRPMATCQSTSRSARESSTAAPGLMARFTYCSQPGKCRDADIVREDSMRTGSCMPVDTLKRWHSLLQLLPEAGAVGSAYAQQLNLPSALSALCRALTAVCGSTSPRRPNTRQSPRLQTASPAVHPRLNRESQLVLASPPKAVFKASVPAMPNFTRDAQVRRSRSRHRPPWAWPPHRKQTDPCVRPGGQRQTPGWPIRYRMPQPNRHHFRP